MAYPGEFQNVAPTDMPGGVPAEATEVVVVSEAEVGKRSAVSIFPLLLGVLILALDIYLLVRLPNYFFAKNFQGAICLALLFASGIICLFLIAYAFGRFAPDHPGQTSPYVKGVVVPLVLGAIALAATVGGMQSYQTRAERQGQAQKSCIDLIEQAHNIAKDNPKFRMPAKDRDEVRCAINAALGR